MSTTGLKQALVSVARVSVARVMPLAEEIATVCFANGIFLNGCGCCGTLTYKGMEFDSFTIDAEGAVAGSALLPAEGDALRERVSFAFNAKDIQGTLSPTQH